jgi:hypothetical protein
MPIAMRDAEILWDGRLASRTGRCRRRGARGRLDVTRALRTERPDRKMSLERLIAAPQGGSSSVGRPEPTGILMAIVRALVWAGRKVRH